MAAAVAEIAVRLDRLPNSRELWRLVALLSFGAFFEMYDVSLTAYLSPALVAAGVFHKGSAGLFGLSDQAAFAAATFAGLWIGTLAFAFAADRLGRRPIFTLSLVWYAVATVIMGLQSSALAVDLWRLVAGMGVGVQLVAIDCYLAELAPRRLRGRAFAVSNSLQFLANPACAVLALTLAPHAPFDVAGWRWLAFVPALGALGVVFVQRHLPESPRWLAEHGRPDEALAALDAIEARIERAIGRPLPPAAREEIAAEAAETRERGFWRPPYRGRFVMLAAFQLLQTVGYYGFVNWAPSLLEAQGVNLKESLGYSAAIALSLPLAPLLFVTFADRIERKHQIVAGALGTAAFGLLFARQGSAAGWIVFGVLTAVSASLMSYGYHAYQSELFPTRVRARAVGATYSFSRLSAIFSSFAIGALLDRSGAGAVFAFISAAMLGVAVIIGGLGPRTRDLTLEAIAR